MTTRPEVHKRYNDSAKGRARKKRYDLSEKGREKRRIWEAERRERSSVQYAKRLLVSRRYKALRRRSERRAGGQVQDEG